MALGDLAGRSRISATNPEGQGECDRCGRWYNLSRLQRQFQWAGTGLRDTGYLVCPTCLDTPWDQLRTLILPPDPRPLVNPRVSPDITGPWPLGNLSGPTTPGNNGFTQIVLDAPSIGDYPTTKSAVLAQIAAATGVPTPAGIVDRSVTTLQNKSVAVMAANPARTWLAIYSPAVPPVAMALATQAFWGAITNMAIGPGQAWFWADAQLLAATYKGAISIVGLTAGMPLFAWEAN